MTVEELRDYVSCGREIEFEFKGKRYSITYFEQNKKTWISFCEFYQEPTDVKTVDELLMVNDTASLLRICSHHAQKKIFGFSKHLYII